MGGRFPADVQLVDPTTGNPVVGATQDVYAKLQVTDPTPLPAALPLFATGLGEMGLFGWRKKRKNCADPAAA